MKNPYIAGAPVTGSEMFFGREDVFTFARQMLVGEHRDNILVLYGQQRTGKTSILYRMSSQLDEHYLCIFVDLSGLALEGLESFLWELANYMGRVLHHEYHIDFLVPDRALFIDDPRGTFENEFLMHLWAAIGDRHILLMLDEVTRLQEQVQVGKLGQDIFEYLRHLMQHYERLNFLFALSCSVEKLKKEYTLLFSIAVYKEISFLERDTAIALMTKPVQGCYTVGLKAQEKVLQITSGHPYYTQLLCHCLFKRWQQHGTPSNAIESQDIDSVLEEAVELGFMVMKYIWEESTPAEKFIISRMSVLVQEPRQTIKKKHIKSVGLGQKIPFTDRELVTALTSLMARNVIFPETTKKVETYGFTVDLLRRWIHKYRRPERVKEEITSMRFNEQRLSGSLLIKSHRGLQRKWIVTFVMTFILIISGAFTLKLNGPSHISSNIATISIKNKASADTNRSGSIRTATAQANSTQIITTTLTPQDQLGSLISQGKLVINDPLHNNSKGYGWNETSSGDSRCSFINGSYHSIIQQKLITTITECQAQNTNFSNFILQVEMTIIAGDGGGLIFCSAGEKAKMYRFRISRDGNLDLIDSHNDNYYDPLYLAKTSAFNSTLNKPNLLTVAVRNGNINLFINRKYINTIQDKTLISGKIGVFSLTSGDFTNVAFSNIKVWQL